MSIDTNKIDAVFSEWDTHDSPGCALAVIKNEEIVYKRGYGSANLEHDIPITSTTVFDIGSTSKQFTALCILLLAKQEKLSLDDDVHNYIPELARYDQPITIRHLIHHTSGIRDYLALMGFSGMQFENDYPDEEIIELICRQKALNFKPGDEYMYSNSGYVLLAEIVKRVSGTSLRNFAEEWIFAPLGMKKTHFHDDFTKIVQDRASGYLKVDGNGYQIGMSNFDIVGDGGMYTTVEDLSIWSRNFNHNTIGGYGNELIKEFTTPGKLNNGELLDYAFGLQINEYKGSQMISHGGVWAGYRAQMLQFPKEKFSVICLANLGNINPTELAKAVADLYLSSEPQESGDEVANNKEIQPIELPRSEIESKTGFYHNHKTGNICEIVIDEGKLFAEVFGFKFQIVPTTPRIFQAVDIPFAIIVEFDPASENEASQVKVTPELRAAEKFWLVKSTKLNDAERQRYVGTYFSAELNVSYKLMFIDGNFILKRKGGSDEILKPINEDLFKGEFFSLRFTRNNNLKIDGFSLSADRLTNLRFKIT